jgi:hypothetical protein
MPEARASRRAGRGKSASPVRRGESGPHLVARSPTLPPNDLKITRKETHSRPPPCRFSGSSFDENMLLAGTSTGRISLDGPGRQPGPWPAVQGIELAELFGDDGDPEEPRPAGEGSILDGLTPSARGLGIYWNALGEKGLPRLGASHRGAAPTQLVSERSTVG